MSASSPKMRTSGSNHHLQPPHTWGASTGRRSRQHSSAADEPDRPLQFPSMGGGSSSGNLNAAGSGSRQVPHPSRSSRHSRPASIATSSVRPSTTSMSSLGAGAAGLNSAETDRWWERVLPPGQLAERLRRAQAMTGTAPMSGSSSSGNSNSSNNNNKLSSPPSTLSRSASALRHATPTEKATWKNLAGLSRSSTMSDVAPSSRDTTTHSSRRSSRSSLGDYSSGITSSSSSSGNDDSPIDGRSPTFRDEMDLHPSAAAWLVHQPQSQAQAQPPHSFSRSQSCRRTRRLSEDGMGLGIAAAAGKQSLPPSHHELDERLRLWRGFEERPSSSRSSFGLTDTPEATSEEEEHDDAASNASHNTNTTTTTTTTTRTTRRLTRTISTTSYESSLPAQTTAAASTPAAPATSLADKRRSMPVPRRRSIVESSYDGQSLAGGRHVSFNREVAVSGQPGQTQTLGRSFGRSSNAGLSDTLAGRSTVSLHDMPASTSSARQQPPRAHQPAQQQQQHQQRADNDVRSHARSHLRHQRSMSQSAPNSPRHSIRLQDHERPRFRRGELDATVHTHRPDDAGSDVPDLALLTSLSAASNHFSSAGHLALTLTRQLSAPLRPVLHVTLFIGISSATCLTLSIFLIASYLLTVWDDVNSRGQNVKRQVGAARRNIEASISWSRRMLTGGPVNAPEPEPVSSSTRPSGASSRKRTTSLMSGVVTAPIKLALAVPATIAYTLTPTAVSQSFGIGGGGSSDAEGADKKRKDSTEFSEPYNLETAANPSAAPGRASSPRPKSSRTLPPRPPLSSLLPSIFFTLLIAVGAGLASFFASRAAAAAAAAAATAASNPSSPAGSHPAAAAAAAGSARHSGHTRTSSLKRPPSSSSSARTPAFMAGRSSGGSGLGSSSSSGAPPAPPAPASSPATADLAYFRAFDVSSGAGARLY